VITIDILVYFATFLSCLGNVFIILKNKLGFWIWIAGNIAWIYVDWFTPNMKPQIIMMVVYAGLNIWGLIEWSRGTNILNPLWEIENEIKCADCGNVTKGYRIVKAKNYDKTQEKFPEFRCEKCSRIKSEELKNRGVIH
jgi:hypothetical protein